MSFSSINQVRPLEARWAEICLNFLFVECDVFTRLYSFLHFNTQTIRFFFYNLRFDDVFHSGLENCRVFRMFICWVPFSKQLLFSVWLVFRSMVLFLSALVLRSTSHFCPFKPALTSNWISFVFLAVSVVFRPVFIVLHAPSSRPSPAAMFCFAPQFPLSSDWLPFVPRTSSRPSPRTLFCFEPEFLLLSTDLLSFRALVPGLLPPALFCSAQRFPMHSHPHSFVSCAISFHFAAHILLSSSLAALCLSTFSTQ